MSDEESIEDIDLSSIKHKADQPEPKKDKKERAPPELIDFEKKIKKVKPTKEKPSDEDVKRKRALILHLGMYLNQFPDELKSFKKINLEKKNIEELQSLLKEFHVVMDSKNNLNAETQAILSLLQAYEYIMVEFAGINCNGLTLNVAQDPDAMKNIKLIILKHSPLVTVEPEARLLMKVLMTTMHLHTINSYNQQIQQHDNKMEKINEEFNDI